jgi:hypothetical protein
MQYNKRLLIQNEGYINASRIEKNYPFIMLKLSSVLTKKQ